MAQAQRPFNGWLGDTDELRVMEYLVGTKVLRHTVEEVARGTGMEQADVRGAVAHLVGSGALLITGKIGVVDCFSVNRKSVLAGALKETLKASHREPMGREYHIPPALETKQLGVA